MEIDFARIVKDLGRVSSEELSAIFSRSTRSDYDKKECIEMLVELTRGLGGLNVYPYEKIGVKSKAWALEVFESWGSKQWPGPWRARGARAYNGDLGPEPPAGSRGRAPGGGLGGRSPLKLKAFWFLNVPPSGKTYPVVSF